MTKEPVGLDEERTDGAATRVRAWLRRVMPRVAVAAATLFVVGLLFGNTRFYEEHAVGIILQLLTLLVVPPTVVYYGLRALRWAKGRLLWRVRRRLTITYLFIGLTPIVLLTVLGLLFAVSTSVEGMARLVVLQVKETEQETLANARVLADAFAALPPDAEQARIQSWLDERTAFLQASLPGARVAAWRAATGAEDVTGSDTRAEFASAPPPSGDATRATTGTDEPPHDAPLPEWLRRRIDGQGEQGEWGGLAFVPPAGAEEFFGSPSLRALVVRRRHTDGRAVALLVVVPVSRVLLEQYSARGGVRVHPFFQGRVDNELSVSVNDGGLDARRAIEEGTSDGRRNRDDGEREQGGFQTERDQFGEPMGSWISPVTLDAANWLDGQTSERFAFMVAWSFGDAIRQVLGASTLGQILRTGLIIIGVFFLSLELLAVISAAWMTRAVTGTVHRLYQATEYIKRGDFSHRVRVRSHDQLGELATAFNEMSANIQTLLQQRVEHERLEREIEIAAEVQAQLFPRSVPTLMTADIAGECRAARGVAGDYYDYIEVAPALYAFALADVSGKGISASLVMSNLQATLRAQTTIIAERLRVAGGVAAATAASSTARGVAGVAEEMPCGVTGVDSACAVENMVESINGQLCRSTEASRFATLFLAVYDDRERSLRYTNAGHNAAILLRADGTVERLATGGMMVGAFDWAKYEEAETTLATGDLLLIFSDGISEAQNASGEEYGEQRLVQFGVARRDASADEMRQAVFDEIDAWSGAEERGDDQTLVVVKGK